eukprot:COSAG01_NODE_40219_length_466_cov_1.043597_1_plen_106_part_01
MYCDSYGAIRFDNILWTMVAVFQTITMEGWTSIMYTVDATSENSVGWLFFVCVVFFAGMFVVQLLLAVITKSYSDIASEERKMASGSLNEWLSSAVREWTSAASVV